MKIDIKKLKDNKVELNVSVPAEVFNKSVATAYKTIAKKVSIPGFRKGKIPESVIDKRIGKASVYEEAINNSIGGYYAQAVRENKIEPIDKPDIEIKSVDDKNGLTFNAKIQTPPEVKLSDYKSIKVEKPKVKVSDADVKKQIDNIRDKFASIEPIKGKIADKSDYLLINFDGTIDGEPFEGGSAKDYMLELGSNTFLPDFENSLIGSKAGEIKDISVNFPEKYPEELAGKTARFRVLIKEVKVKKLPEINDEFVNKQLGEYKNVEELKKEISTDLKEQNEKIAKQEFQTKILDAAAEKANVKIPGVMIDEEIKGLVQDFEYGLKMRGVDLKSYYEMTQTDESKMRDSFKKEAEKRVLRNLTLKAIAEKEKIEPTEIELNAELKKLYESSQKQENAEKKDFQVFKKEIQDRGLIEYLEDNIKNRKVLDFLEKQALK